MTIRLVLASDLPGIGKTSVPAVVARRVGAVHLSIDLVEESILYCGLPPSWQVGVVAYEAVGAMAEQNLRLGHHVVVDAVNDSEEARQTWRMAASRADVQLHFVRLMISDARERERRLCGQSPITSA